VEKAVDELLRPQPDHQRQRLRPEQQLDFSYVPLLKNPLSNITWYRAALSAPT
jgi:hypothetical protein